MSFFITHIFKKAKENINKVLQRAILSNYLFYSLLIIEIILCSYINYNANRMGGMVGRYHLFAEFIASGFRNYSVLTADVTFPMWGYGFIFLITKSKLLIIILQQIFTLLTIIFIDLSIKKFNWSNNSRFLFRLLILLSFNWFFFHTSLYPGGISANLLLLSLFLLLHYFITGKIYDIIFSGISFGLLLNFRSDYYYFAYFLFFLIIFLRIFKKFNFKIFHFIFWIIIITVMLIPWGIHSYKTTGHYLQTSTNGGHVLFISLGQLPNNNWGITSHDGDPKMKHIIHEKFGKSLSSLEYKADVFLKKKWFECIRSEPKEFVKKTLFGVFQVFRSPFYVGDVSRNYFSLEKHRVLRDKIKNNLNEFDLTGLLKLFFSKRNYILIFPLLINIWGILIFLLYLYYQFRYVLQRKLSILTDPVSVVFTSIIFYQFALAIFTFYMPTYNSNIYIIYLILIIYFKSKLQRPFNKTR